MNQIEQLKKIPKEHWTTYNGKTLTVAELLNLLKEKEKKKKK